jgi:2-isopropylmalate synthase
MNRERIYLFDTTLRDGQQTPGVDFSVADKIAVTAILEQLGVDYVEGGYPGANPTDTEFFSKKRTQKAKFTGFGMTKRAGVSTSNDPGLAALHQSQTDAICYVAKSWDYHVRVALGIHAHADTGQAVANTIAAVEAGARQIQGTLNGIGERCGNANLVTLVATLALKPVHSQRFKTGVGKEGLSQLTFLSHKFDEIINRAPDAQSPFVGASAFATKAGIHASAIAKEPQTYEHVPPESVGNRRRVMVSDQGGKSNFIAELSRRGIAVRKDDPNLDKLIAIVKEREAQGWSYEAAEASFELLARSILDTTPEFFEVESYKTQVERRFNALGNIVTVSEAVVKVVVDGEKYLSVAEGQGPVNALDRALRKDLGKYQGEIADLELTDYKVRILNGGTSAVTRVLIESSDASGDSWHTVGVSENIVDASFEALKDSIICKLVRAGIGAA